MRTRRTSWFVEKHHDLSVAAASALLACLNRNGTGSGQQVLAGFGKTTPASERSPFFFTTSAAQACKIGFL